MLELNALSQSFGAIKVLDGVDLSVAEGELIGVLGPNGAGKSALFNLINGNLRPSSGTITLDGKMINRVPPWTRCRLGMGRTFQIPKPFGNLSVYENVLVCAVHGAGASISKAKLMAQDVLEFVGLDAKAELLARRSAVAAPQAP